MWLHMTTLKIMPENGKKFAQAMRDFAKNSKDAFEGCIHYYLIESSDEPGLFTSITVWGTQAEQEKAFGTPAYGALVKNELMPLLIAKPSRASFGVWQEGTLNPEGQRVVADIT